MSGDGMPARSVMRMWTGVIRTVDRDAYAAYVEETGVREYRQTQGNLAAYVLLRDLPDGRTEILAVSHWESAAAIEAFAGKDISRAVYYPEDDKYLVERDDVVRHYEVLPPS